jgi:hypothetical protein
MAGRAEFTRIATRVYREHHPEWTFWISQRKDGDCNQSQLSVHLSFSTNSNVGIEERYSHKTHAIENRYLRQVIPTN